MAALQDCYRYLVGGFGIPGRFYDSEGHRGADYRRAAGDSILAYEDVVIEYIGYSGALGTVVGARRLNGQGYLGWAHTKNPRPVGTVVRKGGTIAQVAGAGDSPGASWDGPHIHTTVSTVSAYAAAFGQRPLYDPVPGINAAVFGSNTAGGGGTPIREVYDMAINWSVSQYDDGTNKQWRLVSEFAWLTIPGDGSEAQLARMTQGEPAGVGPNAWAVLEGMQKLQRQYAAAVAAGSTSGFEAEVVKLREAIDSLELATPEAVAQAVRDEIIKPD